ncbi:MAG: RES family NAD+ phosphorylase [Geoalkalibacter sp.]|jgi:RES domain-containing protein|uniref:RES family NAD+ phosphorylase n=1 Tax=Geoalkalibacter sp. TaxID=3041440 RepID=UPI002A963306|nr:RES family NAD+ phosphorylase [Thermodesulfobacteriota bacterium]
MRVYRIAQAEFGGDLSGEGARLYGGRWNPPGRAMLYTANSTALAALEILVGFDWDLAPTLSLVELEVPDLPVEVIAVENLSDDWYRPGNPSLRRIGAQWLEGKKTLALQVPSAAIPTAPDGFNILLNPAHPRFAKVKVRKVLDFSFDARLAKE